MGFEAGAIITLYLFHKFSSEEKNVIYTPREDKKYSANSPPAVAAIFIRQPDNQLGITVLGQREQIAGTDSALQSAPFIRLFQVNSLHLQEVDKTIRR